MRVFQGGIEIKHSGQGGLGGVLAGAAACSCSETPVQEGGDVRIRVQRDEVGNQEGSGKEKEDLMIQPSRNKSRRAGLWQTLRSVFVSKGKYLHVLGRVGCWINVDKRKHLFYQGDNIHWGL